MSTSTVPVSGNTASTSTGSTHHYFSNNNTATSYHHNHNNSIHRRHHQPHQSMLAANQSTTANQQQHSSYSANNDIIEIKSKFEAEFRRFSLQRAEITNLEDFYKLIEHFHKLFSIPFCLFYTDPIHGDLLPISNDINFGLAIASAKPLLRLFVQRKGESIDSAGCGKKKNFFGTILPTASSSAKNRLEISAPEDFRQVSSIIDVDIVPDTCRRVRLVKHGSDKPLGFYIRDGTSVRVTTHGLERGPGIFISRLVPGGLAESTGLLAVNDEVLEVNGIEVNGKSLDQVTDMMVANSSNLIITIRPANQQGIHHHSNLSASFNTISTSSTSYLAPPAQGHHFSTTNSLERSGHRSKVADYNSSMFRPDQAAQYFSGTNNGTTSGGGGGGNISNQSSHHIIHQVSPPEVIDDDDEDEDEVRDHFTLS